VLNTIARGHFPVRKPQERVLVVVREKLAGVRLQEAATVGTEKPLRTIVLWLSNLILRSRWVLNVQRDRLKISCPLRR